MSSLAYMDSEGRCYWLPKPGTTAVRITLMEPLSLEVMGANPEWQWWRAEVLDWYNDKVLLEVMFEDSKVVVLEVGYLRWHVQSNRYSPLKWKLHRSPE